MSHEIRTPMNGVIGMSRILAHTDLSVDQRDYVSTILRSGESLISIINDILDFSKIEAQKIMIENRAFNLQDLLTDVLKLYNPLTNEKDLNFSLKIGANVPRVVVGDSLRLKQVINNLVNNAIKFTESGFIHLLVDKVDYDENSWTIRFEVKDSGVGIPKNKVSILFDSFSQVDASDSRKFGGTGLGLAICKGLVELMNGDIEVESEVGKGSSFIFNLKFDVSNKEVSNADNEEILDKKLERLKPGN